MKNSEKKYYGLYEILDFLGVKYKFETRGSGYPFGLNKLNISLPIITIPRGDIERIIWSKLKGDDRNDLQKEITMLIQFPFSTDEKSVGIINVNLSLEFRYDKQYKYGDITENIGTVCFAINQYAKKTNDFYIFEDYANDFISYYVIPNQWGIGSIEVTSLPMYEFIKEDKNSIEVKDDDDDEL